MVSRVGGMRAALRIIPNDAKTIPKSADPSGQRVRPSGGGRFTSPLPGTFWAHLGDFSFLGKIWEHLGFEALQRAPKIRPKNTQLGLVPKLRPKEGGASPGDLKLTWG